MGMDLFNGHSEVGHGEDVLAAHGSLVEAAGVGHGVAHAPKQGVLPVGEARGVAVSSAARKLPCNN